MKHPRSASFSARTGRVWTRTTGPARAAPSGAFGSSIASSMAIATAAVAGAAAALGSAFQSAVDNMDDLFKMSSRIGVPIEQLSALEYAANLSDVSIEDLGKSIGKLSKNIVEAAGKPTSEAANAFRALGISVVDNSSKLKSKVMSLSFEVAQEEFEKRRQIANAKSSGAVG